MADLDVGGRGADLDAAGEADSSTGEMEKLGRWKYRIQELGRWCLPDDLEGSEAKYDWEERLDTSWL